MRGGMNFKLNRIVRAETTISQPKALNFWQVEVVLEHQNMESQMSFGQMKKLEGKSS